MDQQNSTNPVNTSKCYFYTGTYETETLRHAQQKLLLLGPKTYAWSTCQGLALKHMHDPHAKV
jgi:hypothetical protein